MSAEGPRRRRTADRISILGRLRGEVKIYQSIAIKEISLDGAQIETDFPFLLDSLHEFRLTIGDRPVVLKARIAHCRISDIEGDLVFYRSGVEFVDVPERVKRAIAEYLDELAQARQPF